MNVTFGACVCVCVRGGGGAYFLNYTVYKRFPTSEFRFLAQKI